MFNKINNIQKGASSVFLLPLENTYLRFYTLIQVEW